MRVFSFWIDGKCPSCNWRISKAYVLAENEEDAKEQFKKGNILCAHCLADLLENEGYVIIPPALRTN